MAVKKKVIELSSLLRLVNNAQRKYIVNTIVNNINKDSDTEIAFVLGGLHKTPADISGWISTGNDILDLVISNKKHAGIPLGRIGLINAMEAAGKSLLCGHLIKSCQLAGGVPIFIDTELSTSKLFFRAIGVNLDLLVYLDLRGLEQIFNTILALVKSVRVLYPNVPVVICVDSITAASPLQLILAEHGAQGYDTLKARINSRSMKKLVGLIARQKIALVFTTQLRASMQTFGYGDKYTTSSGGYALQFYASWRLQLSKVGMLKAKKLGQDKIYGVKTKAKLQKSKLGPALNWCLFKIRYDSGIDNYDSYLLFLKTYKLITGKGTKDNPYVVKCIDELVEIKGNFALFLSLNKLAKLKIYDTIADIIIMKYKKALDKPLQLDLYVDTEDDDDLSLD